MNPYDWQRHRPQIEISREEIDPLVEKLCRGKSGVLLAGRGMGKSVFLQQLRTVLEERDGVGVRLLTAPPSRLTVESCMEALAQALGVEVDKALSTHQLVEAYFAKPENPRRLVLLYDEFDRYGRPAAAPSEPSPGREFFNNLESMRRDTPEVGVLAAGSVGVFVFRDVLGSSFLARAEPVRLQLFSPRQIRELTQPFEDRGEPLRNEALMALTLATGGNPALLTYGLESLWPRAAPDERDVARVYAEFRQTGKEFLRDFELSFADPSLSAAPRKVWELVGAAHEPLSHSALRRACEGDSGPLRLSFGDVLDLLQAAGLVRVHGSLAIDPVDVRPIPSILSLPAASMAVPGLAEQLGGDLGKLLERIHASGADFFRPGPAAREKKLVPEAVFSAFLALGFELLGWQVEREAQQAAGRTDLKLRWNGGEGVAVVEVKIWGRPGWRQAHRQVEKYWSASVAAGAVVMLTDAEIDDWPEVYRRECRGEGIVEVDERQDRDSPVRVRMGWESETPDGTAVHVDHFLLRVPR
jgi:AAA domain